MNSPEVRQIEPVEKLVELEGMYLNHNLQELAKRKGRPIVTTGYVTDINDVIAVKGVRGAPEKLKNPSDWRLFQELIAQSDIIITGTGYMSQFDESSQNVLTQFEEGGGFKDLGVWREQNGLKRSPDVAVVSRSLDFNIPKGVISTDRKVFVFTIYDMIDSDKAKKLREAGAKVIGAGEKGVDGKIMVGELGKKGYRVIKNTTGTRVLEILMPVLDRLYIARVNRKITDDLSNATTVLEDQKIDDLSSKGFRVIERYVQDKVTTNDGFTTSQEFLVYEKT